jgi:hypothetical protein
MGRLDAWTTAYPQTFRSCVGFAHGVSAVLVCGKGGSISLSGSAKRITSFSKYSPYCHSGHTGILAILATLAALAALAAGLLERFCTAC